MRTGAAADDPGRSNRRAAPARATASMGFIGVCEVYGWQRRLLGSGQAQAGMFVGA